MITKNELVNSLTANVGFPIFKAAIYTDTWAGARQFGLLFGLKKFGPPSAFVCQGIKYLKSTDVIDCTEEDPQVLNRIQIVKIKDFMRDFKILSDNRFNHFQSDFNFSATGITLMNSHELHMILGTDPTHYILLCVANSE